jgi:MoxR-like ATPase
MPTQDSQAPKLARISGHNLESLFAQTIEQIGRVILGKQEQIRLALACLFAQGHLLVEDMPGIGKTTLAKVLAGTLGLDFHRVQCTSDMLPGDILGVSVFEQKSGGFVFHPGPVFTQVLLADEINRATPKTQSALLEAMEERQVTIEGQTRPLPGPFFVIATQNPLEQAGTYPLPESQLDRFLMRTAIGYPDRASEHSLLAQGGVFRELEEVRPVFNAEKVARFQKLVLKIHTSQALIHYVQDILEYTRKSSAFRLGLSPRAGLAILAAARAWVFINGRNYVLPEDVQKVLPYVAGHRLRGAEGQDGFAPDELMGLLLSVPVPS